MSMAAGGSSSQITLKKIKYDVFISFRGEDTRSNFTSHLHSALSRKKIKAFIDENDLKTGDEISPTLLKAIEESKLCLIILSEDYASSRWCLEELAYILQCKKTDGQSEVLPVFYNVEPSDVRKQQGSYADSFAELIKKGFGDEKLQVWRDGLRKIADLSGWTSKSFRSEAKLVDTIVDAVIKKLRDISTPRDDLKGLVGVIKRIEKIESLLHIGSLNVGPVGIWGIGGIGKTTLARAVFNRLSPQFEACSFLEDVREQWKKHGPNHLKNKLFSELMEGESFLPVTKDRLSEKRVLVVFDDVDDAEQFEQLVGDWFGPESKIIVTSRDQQVLRNIEVSGTYEVEELNHDDALELFSLHAFKKKAPTENEKELSKRAVNCAGRVPLALIVFGRHLLSKPTNVWESILDKLQKFPDKKIQRVLKISYDALEEVEQDIFLNIACFFKGKKRDFVEGILDGFKLFAVAGIEVLIDKALITIGFGDTLEMHNLIQVMAFKIDRMQSIRVPEKGIRLWNADDIYNAFEYNRGLKTIEGISLDTSKLDEEISLKPITFSKMRRLKLLMISGRKVSLPQGPLPFPDSLVYLQWDAYPSKSFSTNFTAKNLVGLYMPFSNLTQLWDGVVRLDNLKWLDLKGSRHLIRVPDLSMAPNIEGVCLAFCVNLVELPSSFQYLDNLNDLFLIGCSSLCKMSGLPKNLSRIEVITPVLKRDPHGAWCCLNMCRVPIKSAISAFPPLWSEITDFEISSKLETFPEISEPMECLETLRLECAAIKELPHSIMNLTGLRTLILHFCPNLEFLPESITNLISLEKLSVCYCPKLTSLPTLPRSLTEVDAYHLTSLKTVSSSVNLVKQDWGDLCEEGYHSEHFVFIGCRKLDDNTRKVLEDEAQFRVFRLILCSRFEDMVECEICLPGSEIPRWFTRKSKGSSICFNLPNPPQKWHNKNYLGLAMCVVLDFGNSRWDTVNLPTVDYDIDYTYPNGELVSWKGFLRCSHIAPFSWYSFFECCGFFNRPRFKPSDVDVSSSRHMLIFIDTSFGGFSSCRNSNLWELWWQLCWRDFSDPVPKISENLSAGTATVKISFRTSDTRIKVKKCGVRLLYRQDAERFGFKFEDKEGNDVGEESGSSGNGAIYFEEEEEDDDEDDDHDHDDDDEDDEKFGSSRSGEEEEEEDDDDDDEDDDHDHDDDDEKFGSSRSGEEEEEEEEEEEDDEDDDHDQDDDDDDGDDQVEAKPFILSANEEEDEEEN